ncbi:MAG: TlpA family protein disulfide reductase [Gammaproteobacteria bacterium]|nr:TlpA family protein disulfide reductase [Gammaproteobacteria bacterium]MCI0590147.1 TlpA family protein disulfide reductase [Gammaproteobacteria bacterium]
MKKKDGLVAIFAASLIVAATWMWLTPTGLSHVPDIALKTIDGRTLRLKELRGRPVLLTFWATSCPGCVKEMPHLIDLYNELSGSGFELIGVAMYYDPPNQVLEMARDRQIPYTIALDIDGSAAKGFGNVLLTPTTFLIAPDGTIVQQKIGELDINQVRQRIQSMLNSPSRSIG